MERVLLNTSAWRVDGSRVDELRILQSRVTRPCVVSDMRATCSSSPDFVRDFVEDRNEPSSPKFLHGQDIEVQADDV